MVSVRGLQLLKCATEWINILIWAQFTLQTNSVQGVCNDPQLGLDTISIFNLFRCMNSDTLSENSSFSGTICIHEANRRRKKTWVFYTKKQSLHASLKNLLFIA